MFDVSWSDPTRETVGQRKSRKEQDQNAATPAIQRRASTSSDSLTTKRRPSILTLLNASRKDFSRPASRANVSASAREPVREPPRSRAGGAADPISPIPELPPGTLTSDILLERFVATEFPDTRDRDYYGPSDEPAFTSWASRSASTDSNWSSADSPRKSTFVQPLSPTSFVTQRTEITVASREDVKDDEQHITVVHISADGKGLSVTQDLPPQLSPSSSTSEFHVPEFGSSERSSPPSSLNNVRPQISDKHSNSNVATINLWKPPENWECPSIPVPPPKSSARPPWRPNGDENSLAGPNVFHLQKSLRRMRTANPKIMLERLIEKWTDPDDATINEELEFEKQLWMRTALHACVQMVMTGEDARSEKSASNSVLVLSDVVKILSLYEDHASMAFLSSLNTSSSTEIHHLSTNPFPSGDIYTLTVPSPKPHLPYAPALFTSIHNSLALPALLPSSALPTLLKDCHRVLRKSGSMHLTLIDPCPAAASTGPKLREWLDSHLLLELERKFRCTNPCRLVPGWLADAGFEACGTTVARMRFAAATETALVRSYARFGGRGAEGAAEETREQLRAVVGRMLWEECWGRFCVDVVGGGAARWWEDGEVMEECVGMGTTWEILVVEALKEG